MRRILFRSFLFCLVAALLIGAFYAWRAYDACRTAIGGYKHLRYLLESGETLEGEPADEVLSDDYLMSLFGNNPELVERLKSIVDLGMATDESLKTGEVTAMIVTYQKVEGEIRDAAIYVLGGFSDPKHSRMGFHTSGYFQQELDPGLWLTGTTVMNLFGRDIVVFCEKEKAEQHMALLYDLLNGGIMPLASKIIDSPLHYSIVIPSPKQIAPPNLRNHLQTVFITGTMEPDQSETEIRLITGNPLKASHVHSILKGMLSMARMTFHDRFSGYVKKRSWGTQDDMWWATEYVSLIDSSKLVLSPDMVSLRFRYDRAQNNAVLKTIERAGRDLAAQRAFAIAGELPWEFVYAQKDNDSGAYWSKEHLDGPEWPLGEEGLPTPGSIAAKAERERLAAEKAAEKERQRQEKEEKARQAAQPGQEA